MGATFTIGLHLEDGKLRQQLNGIHQEIESTFTVKGGLVKDLQSATRAAKVLETALLKATSTKGISFSALNGELRKAGMTATQMTTALAKGGDRFRASLNAANAALALSNRQTITLNKHLQAAAHSLSQSFKYTMAQSTWRWLFNTLERSVTWVKNLNDAVNNIAVVTGKAGKQIEAVTQQAIKGSRELRVTAQEYAEGALIFYQQGLNDKEVQRRNEITIKAAKAAGESIEDMSSQLTAIWNTYKMNADEQMRAASVGAKMAAQTAVNFKDIAEAMRSAAAPAAQMGVSYESLASIIATVGDTTQQSASVIGNAFKTIFSRFQQLQVDGTDGEISLKKLSAQIQAMGVQVLDTTGNLLPVDKILQQIGEKWDKWTAKQQTAMAQLAGGTRQYGQFLALMDNYDKYLTNLKTAQAETGAALEQQYKQAIDSIEVRQKNATEAWRRAMSNAFDVDNIKDFYTISEKIADVMGILVKGIDGIPGALLIAAMILREKIWPTLRGAGIFVKEALQNTTTTGRQKSINTTYNEKAAYFNSNIAGARNKLANGNLTGYEKQQQQAIIRENELLLKQSENERLIALENERINTLLATANGELRVGLELRKSALQETLRLQSATFDLLSPTSMGKITRQRNAAINQINLAQKQGVFQNVQGKDRPGLAQAARRGIFGLYHGMEEGALVAAGQKSASQSAILLSQYLQANKYWGTRGEVFKPEMAMMREQALNVTNADEFQSFLSQYQDLMQRLIQANTEGDEKLAGKMNTFIETMISQTEKVINAIQAENYSKTGILKEDQPAPTTQKPNQTPTETQPERAVRQARAAYEKSLQDEIAKDEQLLANTPKTTFKDSKRSADFFRKNPLLAFIGRDRNLTPEEAQKLAEQETASRELNAVAKKKLARGESLSTEEQKAYFYANHPELNTRQQQLEEFRGYAKKAQNPEVTPQVDSAKVTNRMNKNAFYLAHPELDPKWIAEQQRVMAATQAQMAVNAKATQQAQAARGAAKSSAQQAFLNTEAEAFYPTADMDRAELARLAAEAAEEQLKLEAAEEANRPLNRLKNKAKEGFAKEKENVGGTIGSVAASAMAGMTLSNTIETFGNEAATAGEKVGSAVGMLSSLGSAIMMIQGPIGAVTLALSLAMPIISKLYQYIAGAREREKETLTNQIETINQGLSTYNQLTEQMKEMNTESAEYKKAEIERSKALQEMIKDAHLSYAETRKVFAGGKFNQDVLEDLVESKQEEVNDIDQEQVVSEAEAKQQKAWKNVQSLGFEGEITDLPGTYDEFVKMLQDSGVNTEEEEIAKHLREYYNALQMANLELEVAKTTLNEMSAAAGSFGSAETLSDLDHMAEEMISKGQEIDYSEYSAKLIQLAQDYDNCTAEIEKFKSALYRGTTVEREYAEQNLKMSLAAGELGKEWSLDAKSLEIQTREIYKANKAMGMSASEAASLAASNQRMNRGLDNLRKNFSDWKQILTSTNKNTQQYAETVANLEDTIRDLIGASKDFVLPEAFDPQNAHNLDLLEKATNGSAEAIQQLGLEISKMTFDEMVVDMPTDWISRLEGNFVSANEIVSNGVQSILDNLQGLNDGSVQLKDIINPTEFAEAMNELAAKAGWTKEQVQAQLAQMSMTADVEEENKEFNTHVPVYLEHREPVGDMHYDNYEGPDGETVSLAKGYDWKTYTTQIGTLPVTETRSIGKIKFKPGEEPIKYHSKEVGGGTKPPPSTGGGGGSGGGSGGGKGSKFKPKNAKSVAASGKLGERYANINSYIDKNTKSIDKLSKAQEDAWGSASYRNLLAINNLLVKQGQYLKQLRAEAKDYLKKDLADLQRIMRGEWKEGDPWDKDKGYGLVTQLLYDEETGIIHNWENVLAEMEVFRKNYGDEVDRLNAQWDAEKNPDNETLEDRIAAAQQEYDSYMEFVESVQNAYHTEQDTVGVLYDTAEKQVELIKDWMSHMIELAQIKLDLKISISDRDIQTLDHLIDLWGDLGTQMSKTWENYKKISAENVQKSLANIANGNEMLDLLNMLKPESSYHDRFVELFDEEAWNDYLQNGGLPTSVIEQLHSAYNDAFSYMVEAQNNFRSMLQEWLKLFQYYLDKFQFISKKLSTNTNILDMFTTLMEVTGKSNTVTGSDALYRIAQTKYDTNFTAALLAKGQYQFASNALEKAQESLDLFYEQHGTDVSKYTQAELIYYQELQDQIKQVTEAKDQAFDDVTNSIKDMAGSVTEMLEALTNNLSAVLFENLGGLAYDTSSGTELYGMKKENNNIFLSEIEKNYDLDKLKNTIEAYLEDNDVDNTEYLKILDEINEKRQKGVEITQADYDVLLKRFELQQAIDAYEDSQRFKNTMRLTRDASGNWSYVYSGNNAEDENTLRQNVADKEFELHQAQMNALDEYQEKYYETAMALIDLWYNVDKTRYHSDEKYRQNVDEQSRLLVERLDSYKGIIVKIEEETGTAHSDTMLAWITGTNDGLTTMEGLHDSYLGYIGEFKDGLISESGKILDNFNGDVTEVGDGLDKLEGDYGDLEDVVYDKTDDMIEENADLRDEIHELVESGTEDMNALTETIRISAESMIADLNAVEAAVESLREALDKYDNEALSRIEGYEDTRNYAGYAGRDALANNILGQMATASDSEREALFDSWWDSYDETEKSKWRNKINSVGDLSGRTFSDMTPSEQKQYAKELLFKLADKIRNGTFDAETDLPLVDSRFLSSSASGNYFRKPGITTIAENAPEIVLNPEDTRNILAAVRYVRLAVNNGLSQSASLGFGVAAHNASIGAMNSGGFTIQTPVQQEVQIDANFPNVNVAAEVEDALDMLILQASQYAGNRQ